MISPRKLRRRLVGLALRKPWLIPAVVGAGWAARRRGWFRRPPFLPLPSARYLGWRMETAYGEDGEEPTDQELARYLRWAARMRRRIRSG